MNKFADILKQLRAEQEITQFALAKAINVTQRKVSYWENGVSEPDIDTLIDIANYFDVSIDELVGRHN